MGELRALWWRLVYAVFMGAVARRLGGAALRGYAAVRSPAAAEGLIGMVDRRFTYSGWPYYGYAWTNLHASRLTASLRRAVDAAPPRRPRSVPRPLTRIACVGRFVGLIGFPKELMARCPVDLVIADIRHGGAQASYLAPIASRYEAFDLDSAGGRDRLAAFVNGTSPDVVLNIGHRHEAYGLFDRLDAPCLANLCGGSDLMHHEAVDLQYHGQPEADYFVRGRHMFCGTTRAFFSSQFVSSITGYMDPRGLLDRPRPAWRDRRPLVVCHGSLYKFASPEFVAVLVYWLTEEPALEVVMVGRDSRGALGAIQRQLAAANLGHRVRHAGQFSADRDGAGNVAAGGWYELVELLSVARLAPNPFPMGGGSSRYEAYAMGVPAPHLGVRFDADAWGRPQPSVCEIPSLLVARGTASTVDEYRALGLRCLRDEAFADALVADQLLAARNIADADRWWRAILEGHAQWLSWISSRSAGRGGTT